MNTNIFTTDMRSIYEVTQQIPNLLTDMPAQYIVIENMQELIMDLNKDEDWCTDDFSKKKAIGLCDENGEIGVLLLHKELDFKEFSLNIVNSEHKDTVTMVRKESIKNRIPINFDTSVTPEKLNLMYKHALILSEKLEVETLPVFITHLQEYRGRQVTLFRDDDSVAGRYIEVTKQGDLRMIATLAHEFRHIWQQKEENRSRFYKNGVEKGILNEASIAYLHQAEEIDAEAYGCLYLESLGYKDTIRYAFDDDRQARDPYFAIHKMRIKSRMNEIRKEMRNR